jgi:hypothetical protein
LAGDSSCFFVEMREWTIVLLVAVVAWQASTVQALQRLSSSVVVEMIDGVARPLPKSQFQCQDTDYGGVITSLQIQDDANHGQLRTIRARCNRIERTWTVNPYGVVPRTGRIMRSTISMSRNPDNYAGLDLADSSNVGPASRKLLEATITGCKGGGGLLPSRGCQTVSVTTDDGVAIILKIETHGGPTAFQHPAAPYLGYGPSGRVPGSAEMAATYCHNKGPDYVPVQDIDVTFNISCYRGISQTDFDVLKGKTDDVNGAFKNFSGSFDDVVKQTDYVFDNITKASNTLNTYFYGLNETAYYLELRSNKTADYADKLSSAVNARLANSSAALDSVGVDLAASGTILRNAANQTANNYDRLLGRSAINKNATLGILRQVVDAIRQGQTSNFQRQRAAERAITEFMTVFTRTINNDDAIDLQARQIQTKGLADPAMMTSAYGTPLVPFTDDVGVAPVPSENDLGSLSTITISNHTIRYALMMGGQPYGVVTYVARHCDTMFLLNRAPFGPSASDILEWDGPQGCSGNFTDTDQPSSAMCRCFFEVNEERCALASSSDSTVAAWHLNDSVCITPFHAFAGGNNDTVPGRSVGELATVFSAITLRGLPLGADAYMVRDWVTGLTGPAEYDTQLADPAVFLNMIDGSVATSDTVNMAFWYTKSLTLSYQAVYDNMEKVREMVKGTPPNGMWQEEKLYSRYSRGDAGHSTRFSLVSYEQYFLTVATLDLVSIAGSIDISIDGGAFTRYTDITAANTRDSLLRHDDMGVMLLDPANLNRETYDAPQEALGLSPSANNRGGMITYAMVGNASQFTYSHFHALYGVDFRPIWGDHFAGWYRVPVDTDPSSLTFGRCGAPLTAASGNACLRRDHFIHTFIGPVNDTTRPGTLVLGDIDSTFTVQVDLPAGPTIQTITSKCPDVLQIVSDVNTVLVQVSNSDVLPNEFRVDQVGACPSSRQPTLQPGQVFTFDVSSCPFAPAGVPDQLTFSYLDSATEEWTQCAVTIPLVYNVATTQFFAGPGTLSAVVDLTSRRVDTLLLALHSAVQHVIQELSDELTESLNTEMSLGFHIDDALFDTTAEYQAEMAALIAISADATEISRRNFTLGLTDAELLDFELTMADLEAKFNASFSRLVALSQQFLEDNINTAQSLDLLRHFMEKNQNDAGDVAAAFGDFGIGLNNAIEKEIREVPQGKFSASFRPGGSSSASDIWSDTAGFLGDILIKGGDLALGGLHIPGVSNWFGNAFSLSSGSIRGLMTGALTIIALTFGAVLLGLTIAKLVKHWVVQNDANDADVVVLEEIERKLASLNLADSTLPQRRRLAAATASSPDF